MKYYIKEVCRYAVGVLFIISGLIKINDPRGLGFKLEEYFSPAVFDIDWLSPLALTFALILIILEILLGLMLILKIYDNIAIKSIIILLIGFGFLTFYSAYFNKVTDCGCFGDVIKFSPWQSFYKDVILLLLSGVYLLIGTKENTLYTRKTILLFFTIFSIISIVFSSYILTHLPIIDFRPYKEGINISEMMKIPEGFPKDTYQYKWVFEKENKEKIIITNQGEYPEDIEGTFVDVTTKLIKKGYVPPIHDFTIERSGQDFTTQFLQEDKLMIIVCYQLSSSSTSALKEMNSIILKAEEHNYKTIVICATSPEKANEIKATYQLPIDFYYTDMTTLKTIIRSNPGYMLLNRGTIIQKEHHNDADKLIFN